MESTLQRQQSTRARGLYRTIATSLVFALTLCGTALGQQYEITGIVTDVARDPVSNVVVQVQGTDIRTTTDVDGRYSLTLNEASVLLFSAIGYRASAVRVGGTATVDVVLEPAVAMLEEMVVTGYTEQRRADITGAVSSVDMDAVSKLSSSSVLQRLEGQVAGVTVDESGSPGSRSTVRIRGISSFQNNDPLYIIDGTPTEDTYINWLNPNDIESIQVLKDASAASIYGSRATNGVVIIETKKRGSSNIPQWTIDAKVGMAEPVRGLDAFLITDALEYAEIVRRSYTNAGLAVPENIYGDPNNPTVPAYIWPNDAVNQTQPGDVDESTYSFPNNLIMPGSPGTNWWDAVFGRALVQDYNLGLAGSGTSHGYNVSLNYLNQEGTAAFNRFQRGSARVNTQFDVGRFTIGENLAVAYEQYYGGAGDPGGYAEDGILGKNILHQPVVPVYDIGGNYAAGKAVGLGNQGNPLKQAWGNKDDVGKNIKVFGNVFGGIDIVENLSFLTRFGFNLNEQSFSGYAPISPELSEPSFSNNINESYNTFRDWTWSNTLAYTTNLSGGHSFNVLLGQESNQTVSRYNNSSIANLITTDINARYIQDAIGDAGSKNVGSGGGKSALLSFFGKVDYNFNERYYLSGTVRRDGSSRLGPDTRWGTFPAFSVGWRLSQDLLPQSQFFTNVMLRFGYGITGNQSIPSGRTVSQFGGGTGDTFYDINGTGGSIEPGYRNTSLGNPNLQWEENTTINGGLDVEMFGGAVSMIVDVYQRSTDNLLFAPQVPATAGVAAAPIVNIGEMKNTGVDFSLGYQGRLGATGTWNVTFNASHYKNEIVRIDGVQEFFYGPVETRYGNQVINQIGYPIGAFYGLEWDGFFEDQAAVDAHVAQDGKAVGRIRFKDLNGDGQITADDRTIIGSPHPDLTAGLDFGFAVGAFDFSATLFGTFGNEIFDVQKEFYVFRNFSTNVRRDLLEYSAVVENGAMTNVGTAKYPRLDQNDTYSGQQLSDYYIEDGSYVRLRNLQLGYRLPPGWIGNLRLYVQAENLFTITGYPGLDPSLPAASLGGAGGDIRDQYRGVDRGAYPSNRIISLGINAAF
jgi:TonB-linked SusC/RagA family outer membrane protein